MKYLDLKKQYDTIKPEIDRVVADVLNNTSFIGGPYLELFASKFQRTFQAPHFLPCANGTDALFISLKVADVGPGDEVITTASSWISTSEVISMAGAKPVFIDIDEFNTIDASKIEGRITEKTKAIIPVHLHGQMCDMDAIVALCEKYDLTLIEDCAQAHLSSFKGVLSGLRGDFGTFSFYPGKNLGAFGDAGGIVIKEKEDLEKAKMFANHGMLNVRHVHHIEGMNSRMDAIQAAVLSVKVDHIEQWTKRRIAIAKRYTELMTEAGLGEICPRIRPESNHSFHVYSIRTEKRDALIEHLKLSGVPTSVHYPHALPTMPCYKYLKLDPVDYANSINHASENVSLPIFPEMADQDAEFVVNRIAEFYS